MLRCPDRPPHRSASLCIRRLKPATGGSTASIPTTSDTRSHQGRFRPPPDKRGFGPLPGPTSLSSRATGDNCKDGSGKSFLSYNRKNCSLSPADAIDHALLDRLRATMDLLESIANERALLGRVPVEDRERFHKAIADVYNPDPVARRRMVKAAERERT